METANHVAFRTCIDFTLNTKEMTCIALTQNPEISTHKKRLKQMLIYFDTDTVCKFLRKSPLSSHKTTLKQQING